MKIHGRGSKELCELRIHLRSIDTKFICKFEPSVFKRDGSIQFDDDGQACIEFRDSHEIDQLINILQRFKNDNRPYIGEWY